MYFIRKNIYITIIAALVLAASFPLAASDDAVLSEAQLRLKILGVTPAQNVPAADSATTTKDEAQEASPPGEMPMMEESHNMEPHHNDGMPMKEEAHDMDPHHDGDMPMMEETHDMDPHHDSSMPMMEETHDMDPHHEEAETHMSDEKKMMEAAHSSAGVKIHKDKDAHHSEVHWGYEGSGGPDFWGDLKSEFSTCKTGKSQSPVDISAAIVTELSEIQINYQDTPLNIVNNGHTIQANYQPGSAITIGSRQFELLQFHFHSPSEHTIGGKAYPMVAHLVHKTANGQLGVIGILLKEGQSNPLISKLWAHLPQGAGEENTLENETINVTGLLPKDMTYFNYSGSLTTPPCSEGVNWMLLATPVELSAEQIAQFRTLYEFNARPVQAINGRPVGLSN